jgi:histone-lysine N-methyltransferase SETMAR
MITVFWVCEEVILMNVLLRQQTINSDAYIKTLMTLRCFQQVQSHKNPVELLLQHGIGCPYSSLRTQEAIIKLGWTVQPHPPYSSSFAPSNFHLFRALKDAICSTRFEDDDSVMHEVRTRLCERDRY